MGEGRGLCGALPLGPLADRPTQLGPRGFLEDLRCQGEGACAGVLKRTWSLSTPFFHVTSANIPGAACSWEPPFLDCSFPFIWVPRNLQSQLFVVSLAGQQELCCPKDDEVKALVVLALTIYGVLQCLLFIHPLCGVAHLINE